jgi:integrase
MLDGDIIHRWAVERAVKLRGVEAHRAVARWFYERVGKKAVADITRADVLAFKNALVSEGQTLGNIKVKLSRLRTLLQWAADNDYAATNAAAGIKVIDRNAAKNKRTEFSLEALKAIFESPVYATGSRPTQGRGEAAYWLPLLALFTGARLEELGQLHLTDIMALTYSDLDGEDRTADFISIKEDDETGQSVKNEHSIRKVPVHPELKRLGFLAYCDEMRRQGHLRLFPELKPNKFGTLTSKWGEWFGKYKREICGVTDSRMTFHSFRHTFKQYARQVGVVEGIQTQIMGHSGDSVADDYGSGFYMHPVVEGMAMYKIPGLKLPKAWR